jgi:hypothetical protein
MFVTGASSSRDLASRFSPAGMGGSGTAGDDHEADCDPALPERIDILPSTSPAKAGVQSEKPL